MSGGGAAPLTPRLRGDPSCRIVGGGGGGQIAATYLAQFLAGLGRSARLTIIDGDSFEPGNESRMLVPDLYENKAEALAAHIQERLGPSPPVTIVAVAEYVRPDNLERLIPPGPGESVLLCVDNHATRKLVADHARGLDDICVVSGGNDGIGPDSRGTVRRGTAGNVQVYVRRGGVGLTPDLTAFHPEIANPADKRPDDKGCGELLASAPQIIFTNLATASSMLNAWWLWACEALGYCELVFDIAQGRAGPLIPMPVQKPSPRVGERAS